MMQARIGLVSLLSGFEISPCAQTKIPLVISPKSIVMLPEGGVYLKLKPTKSA